MKATKKAKAVKQRVCYWRENKLTCGLSMYEDIPNFLLSKRQWFHLHWSWTDEFFQRTAIHLSNLQQKLMKISRTSQVNFTLS